MFAGVPIQRIFEETGAYDQGKPDSICAGSIADESGQGGTVGGEI